MCVIIVYYLPAMSSWRELLLRPPTELRLLALRAGSVGSSGASASAGASGCECTRVVGETR